VKSGAVAFFDAIDATLAASGAGLAISDPIRLDSISISERKNGPFKFSKADLGSILTNYSDVFRSCPNHDRAITDSCVDRAATRTDLCPRAPCDPGHSR
jgi:hypothetical protein